MPAAAKKIDGVWRVVEKGTSNLVRRRRTGTPVDGGGYTTHGLALRQVYAINLNRRFQGQR